MRMQHFFTFIASADCIEFSTLLFQTVISTSQGSMERILKRVRLSTIRSKSS